MKTERDVKRRNRSEHMEAARRQEIRRRKKARRRRKKLFKVTGILCVIVLGILCFHGIKNSEKLFRNVKGFMMSMGQPSDLEHYPDELREALEKNPELEEFVKGYEKAMESGAREDTSDCALTKDELKQEYPLFLQWDKRWGYRAYGSGVIGLSGCGPTCMSMTVYYLTGDESITPEKTARYADKAGYYVEGSGTAWSFMTEGAENFGLKAEELSLDEQVMKNRLDSKAVIICALGPGDFTSSGHFIVIYGYDEDGFLVNDPNSVQRSEESWSYDELRSQIRNLWAYTG